MFFSVKETSYQARLAQKRRTEDSVKQMGRDLERHREQIAIDKEQATRQENSRTTGPMVTPGARTDVTPRVHKSWQPVRFGL